MTHLILSIAISIRVAVQLVPSLLCGSTDESTTESAKTVLRKPIPDKLVVLTFDDSAKSHFTIARPMLKEYGFSATFFITEGFDFKENKTDYMTWEEIRQLHD
ncbi:MAG: polysaccharide deacetylase family protein, partial [Planctomycetota bacterium]